MHTQIHKDDQALTVHIPNSLAEEVGLHGGMAVDLQIINGHLTLVPIFKTYSLEELLAGITLDNLHKAVDTGEVVGQETGCP